MSQTDRLWRWCFVLCVLLLLTPLCVARWLPLVDLPQHAAQLAFAARWFDPSFPYAQYVEFNWISNSVLPYALEYALALVVPIGTALKIVLALGLIGLPIATLRLIDSTNGNRWWVFAAFPIGYGYAFAWGFVGFIIAAPIGLLLVDATLLYVGRPSSKRAWWVAGFAHALFLSHVLVLAWAGLAALLVLALRDIRGRDRLRGCLALASVVPVTVAWFVATKMLTPDSTPGGVGFQLDHGIHRFAELFGLLFNLHSTTGRTPLAVVEGTVLLALPFVVGAAWATEPWRFAPLVATLWFHFLLPLNMADTAFVYPRFSLFLLPSMLVALDRRETSTHRRLRWIPVLVSLGYCAAVSVSYYAFDKESSAVARLIDGLKPNKRLLALIDNPRSAVVPFYPYLHTGCWYQVDHGGIADFSFAEFYPNRFRYRQGMDPSLPMDVEWEPQLFDWQAHGGDIYDYFLVRRDPQAGWWPFTGASTDLRLVSSSGSWAVYEQDHKRPDSEIVR